MPVAGRVFVPLPLPLQPPVALGQVTEDCGTGGEEMLSPKYPLSVQSPLPGLLCVQFPSQGVTGGIPLCVWRKNVQELCF